MRLDANNFTLWGARWPELPSENPRNAGALKPTKRGTASDSVS